MDSLAIGTILHGESYHYTIVKALGQGSFGITYLAKVMMSGSLGSIDSEILVAVKEFFMHDFNGRNGSTVTYSSKDGAYAYYKSKFIHEAQTLSKLHAPGIIKVIEQFEENQTAYYVMEFLSGGSLDNLIKSKGKLSSAECVAYAKQTAEALKYMHHRYMLHLDLKPNNIMINGNNKIVLIDFGLSKRFDENGRPDTSTTIGMGTPGYAPAEQANYHGYSDGEFPATMDIYAFGATMFKMLTGQRPPEASIILNEGFPADDLEQNNTPSELIKIVKTCMEPIRKNRYQSMEDVLDALLSISDEETETILSVSDEETETILSVSDVKTELVPASDVETELVLSASDVKTEPTLAVFEMPSDSISLSVTYHGVHIGGFHDEDYHYFLKSSSVYAGSSSEGILVKDWNRLIEDFNHLKIKVGERIENRIDFSEDPGKLSIVIESISKGQIQLSLVAFNTDTIAGNIYKANIVDLAKSIKHVIQKHLPRQSEPPTRELIHTIPNATDISEIWIDYSEAQTESHARHHRLRIGNREQATLSSRVEYIYNKAEVKAIVNGLKGLKLKSNNSINAQRTTDEVLETLTISFYGIKGNLIKKFYAQDKGKKCVGDTAIHVSSLKDEIIKLSPSFKKLLSRHNTEDQDDDEDEESSFGGFGAIISFTGVIGLFALPTYLYVTESDKLYCWLWLSIGLTELFLIVFCCICDSTKVKGSMVATFVLGALSLLAYIVLWICQLCIWWLS